MVIVIRLQKADLNQILSSANAPPDSNPPLPNVSPRYVEGMKDNVSSIESTTTISTNNHFYRSHEVDNTTVYTSSSAAPIATEPLGGAKEENTHDMV